MGELLKRLRRRTRQEREDALQRLDDQTQKGPEAFQRFVEGTRRFLSVPKDAVMRKKRKRR